MWYARLLDQYVEININNRIYIFPVKNCSSIYLYDRFIYLINIDTVYCYQNDRLIFIRKLISTDSSKIICNNNIYISDNDAGTIYKYNSKGYIIKSQKIGEHISDFIINDSIIYSVIYHENKIVKSDMNKIINEVEIINFPQMIINDDAHLYILAHNQFYSYIYLIDKEFNTLKEVSFLRQLGRIYIYQNKIIFNGTDFNYILNKNLNIISQRKSTGNILCQFGNIPVFENGKMMLDVVNNIIYPL